MNQADDNRRGTLLRVVRMAGLVDEAWMLAAKGASLDRVLLTGPAT